VNYSAGLVLTPTANLTASIDYYRIKVDDRIGLTQRYTLTPEQRAALVAANFPAAADLTQVNFFTNGYATLTRGLDAVISFHSALGPGQLALTGAYNHNKTEITRADPGVVSVQTRTRIEEQTPRNTATLTAEYQWGRWDILARARYYGAWTDPLGDDPDFNQRVGALTFFDLTGSVRVTDAVKLTLGLENVFDRYPDRALYNTFLGIKYPRSSPYEKDGRQAFVRLGVDF